MKSIRMSWMGHATFMREIRKAYQTLLENLTGKSYLEDKGME
jgi:hypothetical protein